MTEPLAPNLSHCEIGALPQKEPRARKLAQWDGKPSPAVDACIADAITLAERMMGKIDRLWPAK
jgi:hypothetical protein